MPELSLKNTKSTKRFQTKLRFLMVLRKNGIENETNKLLVLEDSASVLREAIEKAVGNRFESDDKLLETLKSIGNERERLAGELTKCLKQKDAKEVTSFNFGKYLIRVYKKGMG